ncbi:MAG: leucine-rich repeat protein [Bacteroidales bacterium]|nr:leucine-rich repeat protein [Bacteroidales bacterium]
MKKSILLVAAAIGMLAASCNKDLENLTQTPITISATYDAGGEKVAYTEDGANITATWEADDELIVCWNNHKNTLTLSSGAGTSSATFTGAITGTPSANSTLVCFVKDSKNPGAVTISDNGDYLYTSDAFLTQDGSMDSAASRNLYYGTCFYGDGTNISCTFSVNTSMMKFLVYAPEGISEGTTGATLTYKSGSTELAKATFTVGTDGINTIYLTIPAGHYTGEQTLVYHSGDITETETLSSTQANFIAGQTYSRNAYFNNPIAEPLTFEAITAGTQISFSLMTGLSGEVQYNKYDGNGWQNYTSNTNITLTNVGDRVSFRGDNTIYGNADYTGSRFTSTKDCFFYGNVMSLINPTNYVTLTSVTNYAFLGLFNNGNHFKNHPSKDILLPATTLGEHCYESMFKGTGITRSPILPATSLQSDCYYNMFYGCTALTTAPALPATSLKNNCYKRMFLGCIALITAPALPATTLADYCYYEMFYGCTNLSTAPILPATTMANYCYPGMFYGCSSLTTPPPVLLATTLTPSCYERMFYGCSSLTTAPELPATTLADGCYQYMFQNCTSLTSAPDLPARTLTSGCYYLMFDGCTNLNHVKCLATTNISTVNTQYWLQNVSPTGTFIKASSANWGRGVDGIPLGWTVQNQ